MDIRLLRIYILAALFSIVAASDSVIVNTTNQETGGNVQIVPEILTNGGHNFTESSILLDGDPSQIPQEAMNLMMNVITSSTNGSHEVDIDGIEPGLVGRSSGFFDDHLDSLIMYNDHSFNPHRVFGSSIHHGGLGSRGCHRNGRFYDNGRSWKEGRRRCSCRSASIHCGNELCWQGDNSYSLNQIWNIDNRVCRCDNTYTALCFSSGHGFLDGCDHHGTYHREGHLWSSGGSSCRCSSRKTTCFRGGCIHNDNLYDHGKDWLDGLESCRCSHSKVSCGSGFCNHNGRNYENNKVWRSGLDSCRCQSSAVSCLRDVCWHHDNFYGKGAIWGWNGQSCRCDNNLEVYCDNNLLRGCQHNGRFHDNGKIWRENRRSCRCNNYRTSCTDDLCWRGESSYAVNQVFHIGNDRCRCRHDYQISCDRNLRSRRCNHNGRFYDDGYAWREGSRSCRCRNFNVNCDLDYCWQDDRWYEIGSLFDHGGRRCRCDHGLSINCFDYDPYSSSGLHSGGCNYNGVFHNNGKYWREGSQACRCRNSFARCSRDFCSHNGRDYLFDDEWDFEGRSCRCDHHSRNPHCDDYGLSPLRGGCSHNGRHYDHGFSWRERSQSCRCRSSHVTCRNDFCSHQGRDYFFDDEWDFEGRSCRCDHHSRNAYCDDHGHSSSRGCRRRGRFFEHGKHWKENGKGCRCHSSRISCGLDLCFHGDSHYSIGHRWNWNGQSCRCGSGLSVYCNDQILSGCNYNGRFHDEGKYWRERSQACRCRNFRTSCSNDFCSHNDHDYLFDDVWSFGGQQCRCDHHTRLARCDHYGDSNRCSYNGQFYDHGRSWREGSQACRCRNSNVRCSHDFCSHRGLDYLFDDEWDFDGSSCRCDRHTRSARCGSYGGSSHGRGRCSHRGQFYDDGYSWRESSQFCRCSHSNVRCSRDFCSHRGNDYFFDDIWDYEGSSCRCDHHSRNAYCGGHGLSPIGGRCRFNNRFFDDGHYWREGSQACRCRNLFVACTNSFCSHGGRDYFYDDVWQYEGRSCRCDRHGHNAYCGDHGLPFLGGRCSYSNNRFFDDGHYWREGSQACRCRHSFVSCSNSFCSHGGRDYFYDDVWQYEGRSCRCDRHGHDAYCDDHGLSHIGGRCRHNNRFFDDGYSWREGSQACRCRRSHVSCRNDFCSHHGRDYFLDDVWDFEGRSCRCDHHSRNAYCDDYGHSSIGGRCRHNNRFFDDGYSWREGSQACRCRRSHVSCRNDFCSHNGRDYFFDDEWDFEGRSCRCDHHSRNAYCDDYGSSPINRRCSYNGRFFDNDYSWREGSQACRCRFPSVSCSNDFCSHHGQDYFFDDVWEFEGRSCRCDHGLRTPYCDDYGHSSGIGRCSYNGGFYDDGYSWRENSQLCRCRRSSVSCSRDFCSHGGNDYLYDDVWQYESRSCRCDRGGYVNCGDHGLGRCNYNNQVYDHGYSWRENSQSCRCRNSNVRCSRDFCSHNGRDYYFDDVWDFEGRSCRCDHHSRNAYCDDYGLSPIRDGCNYNGRFFDHGYSWRESSQSCKCTHSNVHCSHDFCSHGGNDYFVGDIWDFDGRSCSCNHGLSVYCDDHSSNRCNFNGQFYDDGHSWRDGSEACKCRHSIVSCNRDFCSHNGKEYFEGDKWDFDGRSCSCNHGSSVFCDEHSSNSCRHGSNSYSLGDVWSHGGRSCTCRDGYSIYCDDELLRGCTHKGTLYEEGKVWRSSNQLCSCNNYWTTCKDDLRFCHDNFDCPWPCEEYYSEDNDCMDCRDPSWWQTVKPEFLLQVFGKRNCSPNF